MLSAAKHLTASPDSVCEILRYAQHDNLGQVAYGQDDHLGRFPCGQDGSLERLAVDAVRP